MDCQISTLFVKNKMKTYVTAIKYIPTSRMNGRLVTLTFENKVTNPKTTVVTNIPAPTKNYSIFGNYYLLEHQLPLHLVLLQLNQ